MTTWRQRSFVLLAITLFLPSVTSSSAAVVSDGSYFEDDFNGTSLDTVKWTPTVDPPASANNFVAVGSGVVTLYSGFKDLDAFITSNPGQIDYGAATEWAYEIRFQVFPLSAAAQGDNQGLSEEFPTSTRETMLLRGFPAAPDVFVTLLDGSNDNTNFSIGWGGFGSPIDRSILADPETVDLNRQQFYKLVAHHRADDEIDFYLDDTLVATRSAFDGMADQLQIGDIFGGTAAIIVVDYIRVGEPVSSASSADFDGDDDVDGADFLTWQRGLGLTMQSSNVNGDADNSSTVDAADLDVWKSQFGTPGAEVAAAAVPEPAMLTLLPLALFAGAFWRRPRLTRR